MEPHSYGGEQRRKTSIIEEEGKEKRNGELSVPLRSSAQGRGEKKTASSSFRARYRRAARLPPPAARSGKYPWPARGVGLGLIRGAAAERKRRREDEREGAEEELSVGGENEKMRPERESLTRRRRWCRQRRPSPRRRGPWLREEARRGRGRCRRCGSARPASARKG